MSATATAVPTRRTRTLMGRSPVLCCGVNGASERTHPTPSRRPLHGELMGAPGRPASQRLQERDEIRLLLVGETQLEARIVEVDDIAQGRGGAVVEIGRAPRE